MSFTCEYRLMYVNDINPRVAISSTCEYRFICAKDVKPRVGIYSACEYRFIYIKSIMLIPGKVYLPPMNLHRNVLQHGQSQGRYIFHL